MLMCGFKIKCFIRRGGSRRGFFGVYSVFLLDFFNISFEIFEQSFGRVRG